jgi:hypothetical protein
VQRLKRGQHFCSFELGEGAEVVATDVARIQGAKACHMGTKFGRPLPDNSREMEVGPKSPMIGWGVIAKPKESGLDGVESKTAPNSVDGGTTVVLVTCRGGAQVGVTNRDRIVQL